LATFDGLIKQINDNVENQRDRGTAFEKLVVAYLKNEPTYKNLYSDVWMLNEVPEKYHIPKNDTGVDIVARSKSTGELAAVQAKFYKNKVSKKNIDSFIAESGKAYYSSGLIVSTVDSWGKNAETALEGMSKPFTRVGLSQLRNADINWDGFSFSKGIEEIQKPAKKIRDYQEEAISKSIDYFKNNDRGQLIMAPGTGKTFTSLKIAEALMEELGKNQFYVLYLVPSIQLLSQTLFNWNNDVSENIQMNSFSVVSDRKATKWAEDDEDLSAKDIGFPATTKVDVLMRDFKLLKSDLERQLTVVFSTYQSIDVIHKAQKEGYPEFDLIISDEAHRTTGATQMGDPSMFTKVHSNDNVRGKLRLYQTATPKIYAPEMKKKAEENSTVIASMDDPKMFGKEIYRLGFGDAVERGYLTDYKVIVLTVSENYLNRNMQKLFRNKSNGLDVDDIGRIIGVWNAMVKRDGVTGKINGAPMKRAIAFTDKIVNSKKISNEFNNVVNDYLGDQADESFSVDMRHVDGTLNALEKKTALDWLSNDIPDNEARILCNVKFLTEGIDVPNLDAIIFFSPKKSQVDIVQAVGRIMRKFEGKEYGYIILPIVIPAGETPESILDNNQTYQAVWQVLNALRSTDERFNAMINKLELNKKKPENLLVNGVDSAPNSPVTEEDAKAKEKKPQNIQLKWSLEWEKIKNAIYGQIVHKVGNRRYLEDWSKDVAKIAKRHIDRINAIIETQDGAKRAFNKYLTSLQHNINNSIDQEKAVEMLAQHLITEPIFEVLFEGYNFIRDNPVSKAMNEVVTVFKTFGFTKEQEALQPFYESIKMRASGIDNAKAKQQIIVTLYDKFFRTGFKDMSEKLGIVFTPIQVVDFIVHSVDKALKQHFDKSLASKGVHILDPFTGTGTFIARTLQYFKVEMDKGLITFDDIVRNYTKELHANEIMLLSYYIAAINIEAVFDDINGDERGYEPFKGIVLTDTFESTERDAPCMDELLVENNRRLKKQQVEPITVIIGNPPYRKIKSTANDFSAVQSYPVLDKKIKDTYAHETNASLKNALQNSYIRALRWASDRIGNNGIIGFITSNGYIDYPSLNGVRRTLNKEFNDIYILNLKGEVHGLSPKETKKQGQNIFDIKTGVAIVVMIKDGSNRHQVHYADIGDYLSKKDKLQKLAQNDIDSITYKEVMIDSNGDWINQRDSRYDKYFSMGNNDNEIFENKLVGFNTNRDYWTFGFSKIDVLNKISRMIDNYNSEISRLKNVDDQDLKMSMLNSDESFVSWSDGLKKKFLKSEKLSVNPDSIVLTQSRPFTKKYVYCDESLVERPGKFNKLLPDNGIVMYTPGPGGAKTFSVLLGRGPINLQGMGFASKTQTYPYQIKGEGLLSEEVTNITTRATKHFDLNEEELFYYIYGVLHSDEFKDKYEDELYKVLPRIPRLKRKVKYVEIGKKLMNLHLNYENVPVYDGVDIQCSNDNPSYKVKKMKFVKRGQHDTIVFNSDILIKDIPERAYDYVVNGRSAIEWIMDQYQIKTDKKSGITDDPNGFSDDEKYIFNLLLRIINLSLQTVDLVDQLPKFETDE
jgi:Predicted helicase